MDQLLFRAGSNGAVELKNHNDDLVAEPTEYTPMPEPVNDADVSVTVYQADGVTPYGGINALAMPNVADGHYRVVISAGNMPPVGSWDAVVVSSRAAGATVRRFPFSFIVVP